MSWQTPKTNWQAADVVSKDDFNRIEGNIQHLQNTKETPVGAQAKAEAAAGAVQAELDAHKADYAQLANDYGLFKISKGQPNGLAELDSDGQIPSNRLGNIPLPEKPYIVGSYTGNTDSSQDINLGFQPSAVIVMSNYGVFTRDSSYNLVYGGIALVNCPSSNITITSNGFRVSGLVNYDSSGYNPYRYIAFT